jgi:MinD superfamily P-loop ATPase
MRIGVLSGKGGTGKTFVATNLSYVQKDALFIDCDIEEPNGNIFLKGKIFKEEPVNVLIPEIDHDLCTGCRKCVEFCEFNALAYIKDKVKLFPELCHSCGGCSLLCPEGAIKEIEREIGNIEYGMAGTHEVRTGILNTGEATGVPIISKLLDGINREESVTVDCPPGSSCVVMESIKGSDFCVLVIEPTIFGVQNISIVFELVKLFDIPYGAVINKYIPGQEIAHRFCEENHIPVLGVFEFDGKIAELNSIGALASSYNDKYKRQFELLLDKIMEVHAHETAANIKR